MLVITNDDVRRVTDISRLGQVLQQAYLSWLPDKVAIQPRFRTEVDGFKLVSMGAVLKDIGYAGCKIYSSYENKLCFKILLFSTSTGQALALLDSDALTPMRTAASSLLVARRYAQPSSHSLGVIGLGPLGIEHIRQFIKAFPISRVLVCDPKVSSAYLDAELKEKGIRVHQVEAEKLVRSSQIIVTATRSTAPVLQSSWVQDGTFVAAIGSCLAHAQELDPHLIDRAQKIVVEWPEQTLKDTGDLYLYADKKALLSKIEAMTQTLQENGSAYDPKNIVIYKAVGIALADIAAASLVYEQHKLSFTVER